VDKIYPENSLNLGAEKSIKLLFYEPFSSMEGSLPEDSEKKVCQYITRRV
jgi:hypothetical protein